MKKKVILLLAALMALLGAACGQAQGQSASSAPVEEPAALWTRQDRPVRVEYHRMWEYSDQAETEDPEILRELVEVLRGLEVGETTNTAVEDFTDVLVFTFEDGTTQRLEFEGQCVVGEDQSRRTVDGLERLRALLNDLVGAAP